MEGMHGENLESGWEARCGNSIWEGWELQACIGVKTVQCWYRWAWLMVFVWLRKKRYTSRWHLKPTSNGEVLKEDREVSLIPLWEGVCDLCVERIWIK